MPNPDRYAAWPRDRPQAAHAADRQEEQAAADEVTAIGAGLWAATDEHRLQTGYVPVLRRLRSVVAVTSETYWLGRAEWPL